MRTLRMILKYIPPVDVLVSKELIVSYLTAVFCFVVKGV